jgi:hypothetical protein
VQLRREFAARATRGLGELGGSAARSAIAWAVTGLQLTILALTSSCRLLPSALTDAFAIRLLAVLMLPETRAKLFERHAAARGSFAHIELQERAEPCSAAM